MQPAYCMVLWAHTVYPNAQLRSTVRVRVAVEELVEEADDKLFTGVMYNKQHVVLHPTLPGTMDTKNHLRRSRPTT